MKKYLPLCLSLLFLSYPNLWCMDPSMQEEPLPAALASLADSTPKAPFGTTEGGLSSSLSKRASEFKKKLAEYMDSSYEEESEYEKEIARQLEDVKKWLIERVFQAIQAATGKPLAIVLDIDETALSNWPSLATLFTDWESRASGDFGPLIAHIERHRPTFYAAAINPVLEVYNLAQELGIEVFFISGRPATQNDATLVTLEKAGYKNVKPENIICKTPEEMQPPRISNGEWKPIKRQDIINAGYTILLNIGDQKSDLNKGPNGEGAFERGIKLPNPFYEC